MIVLAIISHLTAAISVMRFPCIFVIPNYCQFTIKGLGSSALIWINFGLDCETDRAHDMGSSCCNLLKVARRSGVRPRQTDISNCCPLLLTKVIELGLANGSYWSIAIYRTIKRMSGVGGGSGPDADIAK